MVGFETCDDAAVYRVSSETAIISTVDFITPPVDDPYWFGQIAAANSISDVYAMGGKPLIALSLVMFPSKKLDMGLLKEILRGANDKALEADPSFRAAPFRNSSASGCRRGRKTDVPNSPSTG